MKKKLRSGFLSHSKLIFSLGAGLFFLAFWQIPQAEAAEITVPRLELASRGWFENDEFTVSSRVSLDLALTGGYKYTFLLGLSLEAADIARAFAYRNFNFDPISDPVTAEHINALAEKQKHQAYVGFSVAKATINNILNLPLSLSYFIGSGDDFCTGDEFPLLFGADPFGTDHKGFFYFPSGIGGNMVRQYNGIHGAKGTGLALSFTKWDSLIIPMMYIYQDFAFQPDFLTTGSSVNRLYSGDLRVLLNWRWLSLETFGGISWNSDMDLKFRGGLMFHLSGRGVEFFAQGGLTAWNPDEKPNVDNMFFLIEPRLLFKNFGVYVTFFYHPVEYLNILEVKERGMADFNIKFMFGNIESGFIAGFETATELRLNESDSFMFRISPFGSFAVGGLLWEAKIRLKPQELTNPKEMMELFIGIRTAY